MQFLLQRARYDDLFRKYGLRKTDCEAESIKIDSTVMSSVIPPPRSCSSVYYHTQFQQLYDEPTTNAKAHVKTENTILYSGLSALLPQTILLDETESFFVCKRLWTDSISHWFNWPGFLEKSTEYSWAGFPFKPASWQKLSTRWSLTAFKTCTVPLNCW